MNKNTEKFWNIGRWIMAIFMFYGGVQHFNNPDFYVPFVPIFLPFTMAIIYLSGLLEMVIALLLVLKKYQGIGSLALFLLLLLFLPIHIWDVFSLQPAIGSHQAALVRLPVQLVFIGIAWALKNHYFNKK